MLELGEEVRHHGLVKDRIVSLRGNHWRDSFLSDRFAKIRSAAGGLRFECPDDRLLEQSSGQPLDVGDLRNHIVLLIDCSFMVSC